MDHFDEEKMAGVAAAPAVTDNAISYDSDKKAATSTDGGAPVAEAAHSQALRLDPYGIPLSPSPTDDDHDPLNWSRAYKYGILFVVCYATFLAVYMTCTSIESFFLLQDQFDATYSQVNWTFAIPSLGLAAGPLLLCSLADSHGRRPVLIFGTILTIIATGCTTIRSLSYGGYMAFRFLQGIGAGPPVVLGFSIIRDISWEHERGMNIGIWVMALDIGGVLGALVGGFTAATGPYWANYHVAIGYGVLLMLELFFLPETLYPREKVLQMVENGEDVSALRRTKNIKPWTFMKIPGVPHPRPEQALIRFFKCFAHPRLLLAILPYLFFEYWWICSYLTMLSTAYEQYSTQVQGLLFIGLMLGTVLAEVFVSGRLSDSIVSRLAVRNNNIRTPEMRIYLGYPGAVLGSLGAIIWGLSIDREWHWITGQIAFVLFSAGMQLGNSVVSTYIFDCYPDAVVEVITFYSVLLNLSAFAEPWFINYWVEAVGYTWCFVTQGLITLLLIPGFFALQKFGPRLAKGMKF